MKRAALFSLVFLLLVSFSAAQLDLKSPFVSDDFIRASQNIAQNDDNNLDEIYFKVMTLYSIDPALGMLSSQAKAALVKALQSLQNRNGGFGDWYNDRSKAGSTRRALEVLDVLGGEPANRTAAITFITRLQIVGLSFGNYGFKSYLQDTDADVSATFNAIKSLRLLAAPIPGETGVVAYLKNHQNFDGGFGLQTNREQGIFWTSTAIHTYRGVEALNLLNEEPAFKTKAITFLQSLQAGDGGFSKNILKTTGSTANTYDAVLALKSLGTGPLRPADAIVFLKNNQKKSGGFVESSSDTQVGPHSTFWGTAALKELGTPMTGNGAQAYILGFGASENDGGFGNGPGAGSNIRFTFGSIFTLNLIGKDPLDKDAVRDYLISQRNSDGGYGVNGISSTESTYRSVYALVLLGIPISNKEQTIAYLKAAQNEDGGFGWSGDAVSRGSNTFRSVKSLNMLGAEPDDTTRAVRYVQSLQNRDGGFGNYLGDDSDLGSTYRSLSALDLLGSEPLDVAGVTAFTRDSQNPDGGFRRSPSDTMAPNNFSLAVYTYDAVRLMEILNEDVGDKSKPYSFISSLRNADLAYGKQPFYTSEVSSTFTSLYTYFILFPEIFNTLPKLSNIKVTKQDGASYRFSVTYIDDENQLPDDIAVFINEDKYVMDATDAQDTNVRDGRTFALETTLPIGDNMYYIEVSDSVSTTRSENFSLFVEKVGNPPTLDVTVSPEMGDEGTTYTFTAIYSDPDGNAAMYVKIKIDDAWFAMTGEDGAYSYVTQLSEGVHRFRGKTSDGQNTVLTFSVIGPVVSTGAKVRPDTGVFENIKALVRAEYGVELLVEDIDDAVYKGRSAWKTSVDENTVYISRDGTSFIKEANLLPFFIGAIIMIGVITVILLVRRFKREQY